MTPEPKDVRLARMTLELVGDSALGSEVHNAAKAIVDAHETNIERGRKQAEERQRAIEETAGRWPELSKNWTYTLIGSEHEFSSKRTSEKLSTGGLDEKDICFEGYDSIEYRPHAVVLALLDAAGKNTTADRLRDVISKALAIHGDDADEQTEFEFDEVKRMLEEALNA
jgi:hypothetical protein